MDRSQELEHEPEDNRGDEGLISRRGFLVGLQKWSKVVIGAAIIGSSIGFLELEANAFGAAWVNRAGGTAGWVNRFGGGGGGWANRGGGGGGWVNRFGGGGTWVNRRW